MTETSTYRIYEEGEARLRRLRRMRGLARLMDTAVRIPGTGVSFGADSVLGLIPGVGDFAGAAISLLKPAGWAFPMKSCF